MEFNRCQNKGSIGHWLLPAYQHKDLLLISHGGKNHSANQHHCQMICYAVDKPWEEQWGYFNHISWDFGGFIGRAHCIHNFVVSSAISLTIIIYSIKQWRYLHLLELPSSSPLWEADIAMAPSELQRWEHGIIVNEACVFGWTVKYFSHSLLIVVIVQRI